MFDTWLYDIDDLLSMLDFPNSAGCPFFLPAFFDDYEAEQTSAVQIPPKEVFRLSVYKKCVLSRILFTPRRCVEIDK